MRRRLAVLLASTMLVTAVGGAWAAPPPAQAGIISSLTGAACKLVGTVGEGWMGTACSTAVSVGGKATGLIGKAAGNGLVQRAAALAAILAWVLGGAKWTMDHMSTVISQTTSPTLTSTWFTGVYLRIWGIAVFFTLLFLFAAAAEALLRSDVRLLARAVFGYLPLAAIATGAATPLTMLLLALTDQMSSGLASLAGQGTTGFLTGTGAWVTAGLTVADPFFAVMAGGLVVAAGGVLWMEMLIREVAVYVVVAMLPLVFAAIVWPARRVWATRTVEVLVALILSKLAIVVVLALGGAALAHAGAGGLTRLLGGLALIVLGAFSPWLLLRLIPLSEVAAAAVGHIRGHVHATAGIRTPEAALTGSAINRVRGGSRSNGASADGADAVVSGLAVQELLEQMQRRAHAAEGTTPGDATGPTNGANPTEASPGPKPPLAATGPNGSNGNHLNDDSSEAQGPTAAAEPESETTAQPANGNREPASTPPDAEVKRESETMVKRANGSREPASTAPDAGVKREPETMVQRADGSWEPLPHTDPNAPITPPPWENLKPARPTDENHSSRPHQNGPAEPDQPEQQDPTPPTPPPVGPEPQNGHLLSNEDEDE